ncbi:disease resistance protein RUN1-like [Rosa chinensis]|uniref:disease resistance protein RUN1-like n=1 Tax=Rosa chinensis TaxID=74649 RepID=UPI001AD8A5AF|nr:disease resistance protein RUN1-like [Rosa chinensis]
MGGSGKTSVAKAIYNKVYSSFESNNFIGSVRETAKELNGKITLQERLLSDILKPTKVEVGDADRGIILIKERLGSKKVLVIVDDVDDVDQLTALAIRSDSFGPGSRIIITTRDRHLLELLEVDSIHLTQEMKEKEALELFSWHAFHNPCPDSGFLKLTRRVVTYCGGLPLALEVLGSFLFKGSISHWESTLKKLEKFPDDKIHKILKTSFDALDENQGDIFLHISCF